MTQNLRAGMINGSAGMQILGCLKPKADPLLDRGLTQSKCSPKTRRVNEYMSGDGGGGVWRGRSRERRC